MPFIKGRDGKPKTVQNPLEGAVGNIDLTGITTSTIVASGNAAVGNIFTDGYYYANGAAVPFGSSYGNANVASYLTIYGGNILAGNASVTGNVIGNVTFSPSIPSDWGNTSATIVNVYTALNYLANAKADLDAQVVALSSGAGFSIPGPFVNQAAAVSAGIAVGEIYYDNGGTVRVVT